MNWTKEEPKVMGHYWYRGPKFITKILKEHNEVCKG